MIKADEIASAFGVNRATVYRWLKNGMLKDRSLASCIVLARNQALIAGKEDWVQDLRNRGWLRKTPWPSKQHLAGERPW